jgi:hypothetical protein
MKKSTNVAMVCTGIGPMEGCGAQMTIGERRLFGEICEYCMLDWEERVRAWRFGRPDADLDLYFGEDLPFGADDGARRAAQTRKAAA